MGEFKIVFNNGMEDYNEIVTTRHKVLRYMLNAISEWVECYDDVEIVELNYDGGIINIQEGQYYYTVEIEVIPLV